MNILAVVQATEEDVKLLARLMRAEAEGDGDLGMLMVGNVGVNRVRGDCLDFPQITSIRKIWFFNLQGALKQHKKDIFINEPRPNEIRLAREVIKGNRYHPASNFFMVFYARRLNVLYSGITNGMLVGINLTVFINQQNLHVLQMFIQHFKEEM